MKTLQHTLKAAFLLGLFLLIHEMPALAQDNSPSARQKVIIIQESTDADGNKTTRRIEQDVDNDAQARELIDRELGTSGDQSQKDTYTFSPGSFGGHMDIRVDGDQIIINGKPFDPASEPGIQGFRLFGEDDSNFLEFFGDMGEDGVVSGFSGKGQQAFIGLSTQQKADEDGLRITSVEPGSPAEQAGLRKGDYLISLNGKMMLSFQDLSAEIRAQEPEAEVSIVYKHEDKTLTTKVKLAKKSKSYTYDNMPFQSWGEAPFSAFGFSGEDRGAAFGGRGPKGPRLGVTIETYANGRTEGVLVKEVAKGSIAEILDIRTGDVITHINKEEVENVEEMQNRIKNLKGGEEFSIQLKRNKKKIKAKGVWPTDDSLRRKKKTVEF